jgi:hypothetical protein
MQTFVLFDDNGDRSWVVVMNPEYNHKGKAYVNVTALFHTDGRLEPQLITVEDGRVYPIDAVIDVRPAASLKAGGCGIRYTCRICGRLVYLFLDDNRWFMERKGAS